MPTLRGRFDDDRPFIDATISIPRFNARHEVPFMVDTGADITVLTPFDAGRLGIDLGAVSEWQPAMVTSTGVGNGIVEPAIVTFRAGRHAYDYRIALLIDAPNPAIMHSPSLLGRDILHRWDLSYNFSRRRLSFTIVDADASVRV